MARQLRIEFPGSLYHVTSRGNARQAIYENDREAYLQVLSTVLAAVPLAMPYLLPEGQSLPPVDRDPGEQSFVEYAKPQWRVHPPLQLVSWADRAFI
jgi:hypothetical protein